MNIDRSPLRKTTIGDGCLLPPKENRIGSKAREELIEAILHTFGSTEEGYIEKHSPAHSYHCKESPKFIIP